MGNHESRVVVGIGNSERRDDGVGLEIIRLLRARKSPLLDDWCLVSWPGDPVDLVFFLQDYSHIILIDALYDPRSTPGHVREWDLVREKFLEKPLSLSTHRLSLRFVLDLMVGVGKMPELFHLIGVVAADFGAGNGLSPGVTKSMDQVVHRVLSIMGLTALI